MKIAISRLLVVAAFALTMSPFIFGQGYPCGAASAPGDPTLAPAAFTCSNGSQTATWTANCTGQPIQGGATWSNGSGSINVSASGGCLVGNLLPCAPGFFVTQTSASVVTPGGANNGYILDSDGLPVCTTTSTVNGSPYTCSASCQTCSITVDACSSQGCNTAGGYSCVSGCCYAGGGFCQDDYLESCGECGFYACDGSCFDPCDGDGVVSCDTFDDGGFTWLCGDEWCDSNGCDGSGCGCEDDYDPIIISLDGLQYELTNFQNGVLFDFFNKGSMTQMAWTAKGWNGGFLALDRNGNGKIDNGTELFGNATPQTPVPGKKPNGFLALAEYDKPVNGGNGDGQIDARDAVYSKLVVWVDKNHNGVSDPGELLTLQQAGVVSISMSYSASPWTDAYGNKFRFRANMMRTSGPTSVYDVLLGAGGKPVPVTSGNQ